MQSKMETYFITGIRVNYENTRVTHVLLHLMPYGYIKSGQVFTEHEVFDLLDSGNEVKTLRWDYKTGSWKVGNNVVAVYDGHSKYLRSAENTSDQDNLGNMLLMDFLNF